MKIKSKDMRGCVRIKFYEYVLLLFARYLKLLLEKYGE